MNNRLTRLVAVVAAAVIAMVPALPASADGDVILLPADSVGLMGYEGSPGATYRVTTNSNYWSAIWLKPIATGWVNYDLTVSDPATGATLAASNQRGFPDYRMVDFIAINSNVRPHTSYDARVAWENGSGNYQIGFRQENKMLLPITMTQPIYAVGTDEQNMIIRDVYLGVGQCLAVRIWNYSNSFGVIGVIPADPSRSVGGLRDEESQVYGQSVPTSSVTLRYTATGSGWHAFVLTNVRWGSSPLASLPRYQRVTC